MELLQYKKHHTGWVAGGCTDEQVMSMTYKDKSHGGISWRPLCGTTGVIFGYYATS